MKYTTVIIIGMNIITIAIYLQLIIVLIIVIKLNQFIFILHTYNIIAFIIIAS